MLFSTDMVRALLDGQKTRKMLVAKGKRDKAHGGGPSRIHMFHDIKQIGGTWFGVGHDGLPFLNDPIKPLHKPGDIIYVRESFAEDRCEECDGYTLTALHGLESLYRCRNIMSKLW
jgi:hypothetical protein